MFQEDLYFCCPNPEDVDHLVECVRKNKCPFKVDWEGKQYICIHLKWDYVTRAVVASMDGYVEETLKEFGSKWLEQISNKESSRHLTPKYGQRVQYAPVENQTMFGMLAEGKFVQKVVRKFLLYAQAINNAMLHALNDITSAKDTQATHEATMYFLNYAANHPNGSIAYMASQLVLQVDSNAAYLVSYRARSRARGLSLPGRQGQ
eukprot:jgi/Psemu1/23259/gm1.23259_g